MYEGARPDGGVNGYYDACLSLDFFGRISYEEHGCLLWVFCGSVGGFG